jgi:hypothetical protein
MKLVIMQLLGFSSFFLSIGIKYSPPHISFSALKKKILRGFSPQANYTDRAIAAGQRS